MLEKIRTRFTELASKNNAVFKQITVAPVKGMQRALVKLSQYSKANMSLPANELLSCIMELKDLARGSVTCETAAQTAQVFANLTAPNEYFKVYKIKNNFADESKSKTD